jgi:shikimate kinase
MDREESAGDRDERSGGKGVGGQMKSNIALIGFMGVGKTEIGRVLAAKLRKKLVEVDAIIEHKTGKSISQIFEEDGEIVFRELEIETIKGIAGQKNQVIDCGGGVVLNKINIDRLRQDAIIVWLTASPEVIAKRTALNNRRPLLKGRSTVDDLILMMCSRQPFYEMAADIQVDTSDSNVYTLTEKIIRKLQGYADYNP